MHEGAPPRPPTARARPTTTPPRPALTAAAWNRRRGPHRRPRLTHWLRSLPDHTRSAALVYLFGALFFAIPGGVLLIANVGHVPAALSVTTLLFVAVMFAACMRPFLHHAGVMQHAAFGLPRISPRVGMAVTATAAAAPFTTAWALSMHHLGAGTLSWLGASLLTYASAWGLRRLMRIPAMHTLAHSLCVLAYVLIFIAVASLTSTTGS